MTTQTLSSLAAAAIVACTLVTPSHAATVYSLASDGTSLIRFDSATPGSVTTVGAISGGPVRLDGLDFRPSNGLLYGYSHTTGSVYTVSTSTGAAVFASSLSPATSTNFLGIDFNPMADRLRIVNNDEQNLRVTVGTGTTTVDAPLAYAAGDPNAGVNPQIIDAAYTHSSLGSTLTTALYYVDYGTDTLVRTSNPNGGVLNTVGLLGIDIDPNAGFDIFSSGGIDTAYGAFRVGGVTSFYNLNLATGAASAIGAIGTGAGLFFGLAVVPGAAIGTVPEPGSLALLGTAGLAAFLARRRRPGAAAPGELTP